MRYYMPTNRTETQMAEEGRALLTDGEREILTGERDVTDNYQYKAKSIVRVRVRRRFAEDAAILRENFPEVFEMIHDEVCNDKRE